MLLSAFSVFASSCYRYHHHITIRNHIRHHHINIAIATVQAIEDIAPEVVPPVPALGTAPRLSQVIGTLAFGEGRRFLSPQEPLSVIFSQCSIRHHAMFLFT